jgi:hypothetical protein
LPVQPELVGVAPQVLVLQRLLTVQQQLVHGPEAALERGRLGQMGGGQGMRMDAGQGKVPKHEPELAAELLLQLLDGAEGHAAVGTFIVAVLDQGDRCPLPAAPMVVVRVHRRRQVLHDRAHHIISSPASKRSGDRC